MSSIAVATFVKTIGRTPVKTRLAKTIGQTAAEEFYTLAVDLVEQVLEQASEQSAEQEFRLVPYWAVAEPNALDFWDSFDAIPQGKGELGDRLHTVYSSCLEKHDGVLLIGSDCVTMTAEHLLNAGKALLSRGMEYVLGPAHDGGFYLFGGNKPISQDTWNEVTYSSTNTADQLLRALSATGTCHKLEPLSDVDMIGDLQQLKKSLKAGELKLPAGGDKLAGWLDQQADL